MIRGVLLFRKPACWSFRYVWFWNISLQCCWPWTSMLWSSYCHTRWYNSSTENTSALVFTTNLCHHSWNVLYRELSTLFLRVGYFNAHHLTWRLSTESSQSILIDSFSSQSDLCFAWWYPHTLLFHVSLLTYIDLSISSQALVPLSDWAVYDNACSSDHFHHRCPSCHAPRCRQLAAANWQPFYSLSVPQLTWISGSL